MAESILTKSGTARLEAREASEPRGEVQGRANEVGGREVEVKIPLSDPDSGSRAFKQFFVYEAILSKLWDFE